MKKRRHEMIFDILTIAAGMVVIIEAVILFINAEANRFILPWIFIAGGILAVVNGMRYYHRKSKSGMIISGLCTGCLLVLAVGSFLW